MTLDGAAMVVAGQALDAEAAFPRQVQTLHLLGL